MQKLFHKLKQKKKNQQLLLKTFQTRCNEFIYERKHATYENARVFHEQHILNGVMF